MLLSERWLADVQRRFDASGRLDPDSATALAEAAPQMRAGGRFQASLLLGSAHDQFPIPESLGHLACAWDAAAPHSTQRLQVRREAARHLFAAGYAHDALILLEIGPMDAAGSPEVELSCRALAMLIQLELGCIGSAPATLSDLLDSYARLRGRMKHRDRMWFNSDLIHASLGLCWRAGNRGPLLGYRLPRADLGPIEALQGLLVRLLGLTQAEQCDGWPGLQVLRMLCRQTLTPAAEVIGREQLNELIVRHDQAGSAAGIWSLLGFCCQLADHAGRALACHRRAVLTARQAGAQRVAATSGAELAALLAARGEYRAAHQALESVRLDERFLWAESSLPLGRRWQRAARGAALAGNGKAAGGMATRHVREACQYIAQNLSAGLSTLEVAHACGISRRTLEQAFRDTLGCTVKEHVRCARIAQVRSRLQSSTDAVKRIALDLGYASGAAMGREFKAHTGQTITAFRQSPAGNAVLGASEPSRRRAGSTGTQ